MLAARGDFSLQSFKDIQFKSNQGWALPRRGWPLRSHEKGTQSISLLGFASFVGFDISAHIIYLLH